MDLERLKQILEAYGSRPENWPVAERHAAKLFLSQSSDAQVLVAEQSAIDAVLDELPAGEVSVSLKESVLSTAAVQLGSSENSYESVSAPAASSPGLWARFTQGSRQLLDDIDTMQWSGPALARSAPVLGSAAILGFMLALYGPVASDDTYLTTSEDEILVATFSTPDYGLNDFSINGADE